MALDDLDFRDETSDAGVGILGFAERDASELSCTPEDMLRKKINWPSNVCEKEQIPAAD